MLWGKGEISGGENGKVGIKCIKGEGRVWMREEVERVGEGGGE